jgi:hypothetical protein
MNTSSQETKLIVLNGHVIENPNDCTPEVGKDIGFEKGVKMIKRHVDAHPDHVIAQYMGRNIIEKILAQPGVIGIRTFYGLNELGINQLVFVGVDNKGNNIINYTQTLESGEKIKHKGIVADAGSLCPPKHGGGNGDMSDGWMSY